MENAPQPPRLVGPPGQPLGGTSRRRLLAPVVALVALATVGLALGAWHFHLFCPGRVPDTLAASDSSTADPRLSYHGPFRNIHPKVRYVGDAACAECHKDIADSYRQHPMGRSLAPAAQMVARFVYDRKHNNPFESLHSRFIVERRGDHLLHRQVRLDQADQPIYGHDLEAHYVIGSGRRGGYSFLTDHDGYLFQTPISWFTQKQIWDLSPGFLAKGIPNRPVGADCLFCHANRAHYREGSVNRYDRDIFDGYTIGCERCHGPGEMHVQSTAPADIVNPRRLEPALREAVCQQCHLEGARVLRRGRHLYDFRPGLPLEAFWSVFVPAQAPGKNARAVSQVEQMSQSRCFEASAGAGQMGCISCHDPHRAVAPAERVAWFRNRCLKCHQHSDCTAPLAQRKARGDSCFACHMPRFQTADIAHTAATDHRILARPQAGGSKKGRDNSPQSAKAGELGLPLKLFHRQRPGPLDEETSRDLGIALVTEMLQGKLDPVLYDARALGLLEAATQSHPDDVEAWLAQAKASMLRQEWRVALTAFENALRQQPDAEEAVTGAAAMAGKAQALDHAVEYWRRAVTMNPWMSQYRANLAALLADQGQWRQAREQGEAWLRLDPESVAARLLRIRWLLRDGQRDEAGREFGRVAALGPPNLERLRSWFTRQLHADLPQTIGGRPPHAVEDK
jgi:Tfp pilus assembly protein PilF